MTVSLRQRALRLLAHREHSVAELRRKLALHGEGDEVDALVAQLVAQELVSDQRFTESYVRSKAARLGSRRLRDELRRKGVEGELVDAALAHGDIADDMVRAREIWARKFGSTPSDPRDWARQTRFLQTRGFPADVIRKLLKEPHDESA
jgi:regulatory protein